MCIDRPLGDGRKVVYRGGSMLLKEAMKETGLSKKAIQYYEEQGLVKPKKLENKYRDYDATCIETLRYIRTLRTLGLNMEKIKRILTQGEYAPQIYEEMIHKIDEDTSVLQKRKQALHNLMEHKDVDIQDVESKTLEAPYIYIYQTNHFLGLLYCLAFIMALLLYRYLPLIHDGWPLAVLYTLASLYMKKSFFETSFYRMKNQSISLKKIRYYFFFSFLENLMFMLAIKQTLQTGIIIYIAILVCMGCYIVWINFHLIKDEEFYAFHYIDDEEM